MTKRPERLVLCNDDGWIGRETNPPLTVAQLRDKIVATYRGSPVGALLWCVGDHEVYEYETEVGERFGEAFDIFDDPRDRLRAENLRHLIDECGGPLTALTRLSHEAGLDFFPSVRMNSHYVIAESSPGYGRFRRERPDLLIGQPGEDDIGRADIEVIAKNRQCLLPVWLAGAGDVRPDIMHEEQAEGPAPGTLWIIVIGTLRVKQIAGNQSPLRPHVFGNNTVEGGQVEIILVLHRDKSLAGQRHVDERMDCHQSTFLHVGNDEEIRIFLLADSVYALIDLARREYFFRCVQLTVDLVYAAAAGMCFRLATERLHMIGIEAGDVVLADELGIGLDQVIADAGKIDTYLGHGGHVTLVKLRLVIAPQPPLRHVIPPARLQQPLVVIAQHRALLTQGCLIHVQQGAPAPVAAIPLQKLPVLIRMQRLGEAEPLHSRVAGFQT